jgi:hypothetical protein
MKDKLFEEWAKTHKYKTNIEEGFYTNTHTQSAWEAWKESTPKELSDEEILKLWTKKNKLNGARDIVDFAKAILKKASEK